ncbi:MAG: hypothetical protein ABIB46_04145 [bacterium]
MPDLITHFISIFVIRRWLKNIWLRNLWLQNLCLVYLGVILPDIFSRTFQELFPDFRYFFMPLHTPFTLLIVCYLIAQFFDKNLFKKVFTSLIIGVFCHFFLDSFQILFEGDKYSCFFLFWTPKIPIFWPEDCILALPYLIGVTVIIEFFIFIKKRT